MFFIKNFKMKTINEPANPPANNENPKNKITLAAHALDGLEDKNDEEFGSLSKLDFSIELTINIPNVEQMNGIQSTNVI